MGIDRIKIRSVREDEIGIICSLGKQTFYEAFADQNDPDDLKKYLDESFTREKIESEFQNQDSSFYFSLQGETITGYLKLNKGKAQTDFFGNEYLEVERLYVLEKYKATGIGRSLMKKAFEIAESEGSRYVWLGVWEFNEPAKAFYKKLGFERYGQHTFQLGNDPQTDIILRKPVKPAV
jgi:ribosomal protein S18 acetylase RimI-like enzyme